MQNCEGVVVGTVVSVCVWINAYILFAYAMALYKSICA